MSGPSSCAPALTRTGPGIHSIEDLKARCHVDADTDCWLWGMSVCRGAPAMWIPGLNRRASSALAICFLVTGERPKRGNIWHRTCDNPLCCNPDHRNRRGTKSSMMLAAKIVRSPVTRAKMSRAMAAGSPYTDEVIAEIRNSEATLKEISERYGCSMTHASRVRLRRTRTQAEAAANSSVFAFQGAI